jgi:HEAT repeat protein
MGFFDLLSKEGRQKSALEGAVKKVQDKYGQSADRYGAMERLKEIGSEDAFAGLCKRWDMDCDKTIENEEEKQWVVDTMTALGDRAIEPIRRFLRSSARVSYGLRVLEQIAPEDKVLAIVDEVLAKEEPGYTRDPSKRQQLITWLGQWTGPAAEVAKRVVPYLADFDQEVRFAAVEALASHLDEASSRAPLLDALLRPEEESRRIKIRAAEVLAQAGWTVTDRKEEVQKLLGDLTMFGMEHDKLKKKAK